MNEKAPKKNNNNNNNANDKFLRSKLAKTMHSNYFNSDSTKFTLQIV